MTMTEPPASLDPRLACVDCMIQATSAEHHHLWSTFSEKSDWRPPYVKDPLVWEEDGLGRWAKVGELAGYPIAVSWSFAVIDGAVICFYEPTSRVVDYNVVREWSDSVCATHTNATNFHNRPRSAEPTPNVSRYRDACAVMRGEMRAKMDAEAAQPPTPRDPDDQGLADRGIPVIDDGQLRERVYMVVPVDHGTHRRIRLPDNLRTIAFTWSPVFGDVFAGLEPAKTVKTLHTHGAPSLFKPSIAEVLAQAPDDLHEYVAFSLRGPETAEDMNRYPACTNAGYHVAEVTYYRKAAP
jgi:hypothetical protein